MITNAQSRAAKATLTRAEKTKNKATILAACDKVQALFDEVGYPDWWHRLDRLRMDAHWLPDAGSCRDCGDSIPAPSSASKYHTLCGSCLVTYV